MTLASRLVMRAFSAARASAEISAGTPGGAAWAARREKLAKELESMATSSAAATVRVVAFSADAGPALPPGWINPVAQFFAALEARILDPSISSAELIDGLEAAVDGMPELIDDMDVDGLADQMEAGLGQAVLAEVTKRVTQRRPASPWLRRASKGAKVESQSALGTRHSALGLTAFAAVTSIFSLEPIAEAVAKLDRKSPVAVKLTSAEWARVPLALRERAQFSANVESATFLSAVQEKIHKRLALETERIAKSDTAAGGDAFVNRDSFIRDLRRIAEEEGIVTAQPGEEGGVRDIRSVRRLGLIWDMQTNMATGFARWKVDNDADVLDEFPAYRLAESTADEPRPELFWEREWFRAGTEVGWEGAARGAMVALKTSPIWMALSRFGTPWPPFDYGSHRELEDVDRTEAVRLGLLHAGEPVPQLGGGEADFNDGMQQSAREIAPELLAWLQGALGSAIEITGGVVHWAGGEP